MFIQQRFDIREQLDTRTTGEGAVGNETVDILSLLAGGEPPEILVKWDTIHLSGTLRIFWSAILRQLMKLKQMK